MVITLPDQLKSLQGLTETEVLEDLAVSFYAARRVTLVQAADLARKSLFEFQALTRRTWSKTLPCCASCRPSDSHVE